MSEATLTPKPADADTSEESDDKDAEATTDASSSSSPSPPPPPAAQLHDYVIGMRLRSKVRTLHLIGACWRQPGKDFIVGDWCGAVAPEPSRYNSVCRNCFVRPLQLKEPFAPEESPTTGSSSE